MPPRGFTPSHETSSGLISVTSEKKFQCQHIIPETSYSNSESSENTTASLDNDISDILNTGM